MCTNTYLAGNTASRFFFSFRTCRDLLVGVDLLKGIIKHVCASGKFILSGIDLNFWKCRNFFEMSKERKDEMSVESR